MAKIIGQIESLKTLRNELNQRNIKRFNSIADINKFRREFSKEKRLILEQTEKMVNEEINLRYARLKANKRKLEFAKKEEPKKINQRIEKNIAMLKDLELKLKTASFLDRIILRIRIKDINNNIQQLRKNYDNLTKNAWKKIENEILDDANRLIYLTEDKEKAIYESSRAAITNLENTKRAVDEMNSLLLGAIGESLVEKEIQKLSDDYTLINDFKLDFNPPIYNRKTNDRIYSIQVDHLLISRAGLFILETKNWSKESIQSLDLRSPVDQITRTSFAIFVIVNNNIQLNDHHWGAKQIPVRSIIVMINSKPKANFKYVKIKLLKELNSYIQCFDPVLNDDEVEAVASYLVGMNS